MAPFTFALLAIITASLASAGPVALDNATLLLNGQQALLLNCQFQNLQVNDSCNSGDTACIQGATATCVNGTWQTLPCPSSKSCFALPEVRTSGTFIACTSSRNAASIIGATGIQTDIASNCTSLGTSSFPFSTNNTVPGDDGNSGTQGGNGTSSLPGQVVTSTPATITLPLQTLPPTTSTLFPEQSSSSISSSSVPSGSPVNNLGDGGPPLILLTPNPFSSPAPTPTSTPPNGSPGYSN